MNNKIKIMLGVLALVALIGAGCNQTNQNTQTNNQEPIKIGFALPLSGDIASMGENIKDGAIVAMNEINAAGGIGGRKLDIIFEDGKCDGKTALNAANKLIFTDKVTAMMTICSDETLAAAPVAEQNKIVLLSPASTNMDVTNAGDYVFRIISSDSFQGKFVADYIFNQLGKRHVAIIYDSDKQWSVGVKTVFEKRFAELGGAVVANEGVLSSAHDVRTTLAKVKSANPELVYAPTFVDSGIVILKQAREIGIAVPFIGGDVWDDTKIAKEAGASANGARFTVVANKKNPDAFVSAMAQLPGGKDINAYAPRTYDAVKILAEIMGRVGTDSDKIKAELYKLNNYQGIADNYSLDSNGDMISAQYTIKEFRDGAMVEVK